MRLYHNTSSGDPLLGRLCQHACGLELSTNIREVSQCPEKLLLVTHIEALMLTAATKG